MIGVICVGISFGMKNSISTQLSEKLRICNYKFYTVGLTKLLSHFILIFYILYNN